MFKGTYKAELVVDIHIDTSIDGVKPFEKLKMDLTDGRLTEELRDLIADELSEDEGMSTVTLRQLSAELEEVEDG